MTEFEDVLPDIEIRPGDHLPFEGTLPKLKYPLVEVTMATLRMPDGTVLYEAALAQEHLDVGGVIVKPGKDSLRARSSIKRLAVDMLKEELSKAVTWAYVKLVTEGHDDLARMMEDRD